MKKILLLILLPILAFAESTVSYVTFNDVYDKNLAQDAITRNEHPGFYFDFLVLHCLIRKYSPTSCFEIGTCDGSGTQVIKNAIREGTVYSLELAPEQQREYRLTKERIGSACRLPYIQLFGDSLSYNYAQNYPIDSWFIDGAHDYRHVSYESKQALKSRPKLIVWHDTDIPDVFNAIVDVFKDNKEYKLIRVSDTRVTYAISKIVVPGTTIFKKAAMHQANGAGVKEDK